MLRLLNRVDRGEFFSTWAALFSFSLSLLLNHFTPRLPNTKQMTLYYTHTHTRIYLEFFLPRVDSIFSSDSIYKCQHFTTVFIQRFGSFGAKLPFLPIFLLTLVLKISTHTHTGWKPNQIIDSSIGWFRTKVIPHRGMLKYRNRRYSIRV